MTDTKEYDIVFAGGGTSACVAAGRLAKNNPDLSILLIEQGQNNLDNPMVRNPALFLTHLAPDSKTALFYQGNKSDKLNGRAPIVPAGGILGGGSSINFMMYTRAQGIDFDSWKTDGWDAKSLLPLMKRLESYQIDKPGIDQNLHGHDGPIGISYGPYHLPEYQDDFLAACKAVGYDEIQDLQDLTANNAFSRWARYVGADGKRQDAAHRCIHPLMASGEGPNLHLLVNTTVSRVNFANGRAESVECVPTARQATNGTTNGAGAPTVIKAKKLIVVSAGAMGTPSILERSGVGSADILTPLGIPVVSDLKGVGENYQDHHLLLYPYRSTLQPHETIDQLLTDPAFIPRALEEQNPMLGWNAIDVGSKVRPTEEAVDRMGPEFRKLWDRDFKNSPTKPAMLVATVQTFLGDRTALTEEDGTQFITAGTYTAYPYSRGSIHITSTDPTVPASFDTGFLSHPADLSVQVWAYKLQREICRRSNAYAGEVAIGHPAFAKDSPAAVKASVGVKGLLKTAEDRKAISDIQYSAEDDKVIEDWIRGHLETTWHSLGTCKMAPQSEGGVVDANLNVYGTTGLKCLDLSIPPENVGANTNHTALLVGEKGADIIAKELGLKV